MEDLQKQFKQLQKDYETLQSKFTVLANIVFKIYADAGHHGNRPRIEDFEYDINCTYSKDKITKSAKDRNIQISPTDFFSKYWIALETKAAK